MFLLASPDGYLCYAEPYCDGDIQLSETLFGLGGNVALFCHKFVMYQLD